MTDIDGHLRQDALAEAVQFALAYAPAEEQREEWPSLLAGLDERLREEVSSGLRRDLIEAHLADKADLPWLYTATPSTVTHACVARYYETPGGSQRFRLHPLCTGRPLGWRYVWWAHQAEYRQCWTGQERQACEKCALRAVAWAASSAGIMEP